MSHFKGKKIISGIFLYMVIFNILVYKILKFHIMNKKTQNHFETFITKLVFKFKKIISTSWKDLKMRFFGNFLVQTLTY
jgi:hypothetical protein